MTDAAEPAACETRARDAPAVIHLPDLRQRTKKVTSGGEKRRRRHLEQFRTDDDEHAALHEHARASGLSFGAYMRAWKIGDPGPRAQRRAPVDVTALTGGVVAFNRELSLFNQTVRALNTLALVADERGSDRLADEVHELRREIERLHQPFAAPAAAIIAALNRDSER